MLFEKWTWINQNVYCKMFPATSWTVPGQSTLFPPTPSASRGVILVPRAGTLTFNHNPLTCPPLGSWKFSPSLKASSSAQSSSSDALEEGQGWGNNPSRGGRVDCDYWLWDKMGGRKEWAHCYSSCCYSSKSRTCLWASCLSLCPAHCHVETFQAMGPMMASLPPSDIRNRCPLPCGSIRGALMGTKLPCNRSQVMPYQVVPGTRQ